MLSELFEQRIGALPVVEPSAFSLAAGALLRAACESEEPDRQSPGSGPSSQPSRTCESEEPDRDAVVLLGYLYASLAGGKPLDAAVFLLASAAAACGGSDAAVASLKKIGIDLKSTVNFACIAVELAKFFKNANAAGAIIPEAY